MPDSRKRRQNERKFGTWMELPSGGRIYTYEILGRRGWRAVYVKEVNAEESTIRFFQEIYDNQNILREVHEKYPVDRGHQRIAADEEET